MTLFLCACSYANVALEDSTVFFIFILTEDTWVKQGLLKDTFYVNHCQGNLPVLYNARGWLKVAREHAAVKQAHPILAESSK